MMIALHLYTCLLFASLKLAGRMPPPGMPPGMMGRGMPPPGMPPPPQGPPGMRGNSIMLCTCTLQTVMLVVDISTVDSLICIASPSYMYVLGGGGGEGGTCIPRIASCLYEIANLNENSVCLCIVCMINKSDFQCNRRQCDYKVHASVNHLWRSMFYITCSVSSSVALAILSS
jgi:hypothetical protein